MTKVQAIDLLKNKPVKFARLLGFDKLEPFHNEWIKEMLCGKDDYTLMSHRASYKTTCVSFALAITIILLPRYRTLFIRKTDVDVKEVIKQVQKILLDTHTQYIVQVIYGVNLMLNTQSATEISTNLAVDIKGTSQLVGIGIGSSLTGKHFDRIFTDDIINVNDRISKAERDRTRLIYQELQNIKNRGGKIFNTLTPWHPNSAEALMPNVHKFDCYETGLISENGLEEIKSKMAPSLFACNYELKHIAAENIMFFERPTDADISNIINAICQIDCAYGGSDYTAFTAMSYHDGHFYIYGKCWQRHIEDCYNDIVSDYRRLMLGKCFTETNADKGMVARDMKRKFGMRMMTYHEKTNKHIKISTYLKAIWEYVIFIEGTDAEYINQIIDYTEDAEHDDCPDSAAVLARKLYKKANIKINIGLDDEVGEKEE